MANYLDFFNNLNSIESKIKYLHGVPNLNKEFYVLFRPEKHGIQFFDVKTKECKFFLNKVNKLIFK